MGLADDRGRAAEATAAHVAQSHGVMRVIAIVLRPATRSLPARPCAARG
ncbi:MAG: hypothetical protein ACLFTP_01815 [Rhodosalinus sp.]